MPKVYKICIFASLIVLLGVIANFALAQGKGYFLEKGKELFVFDNINIRGYLVVEKEPSNIASNPNTPAGDVFVEKQLILDQNSAFNFCKDTREFKTNLPLNTACTDKVLVWQPTGLQVIDPAFYQLKASKVIAKNQLIFQAANKVSTDVPVQVTECLANDGSDDCHAGEAGELKTTNLYLKNLAGLDAAQNINLDGTNIDFGTINLGPESNLDNQKLCRRTTSTCSDGANGNSYKDGIFQKGGISSTASVYQNYRVCCFLNVTNF